MIRREVITKAIDGQLGWVAAADIWQSHRDTCAGSGVRSSATDVGGDGSARATATQAHCGADDPRVVWT